MALIGTVIGIVLLLVIVGVILWGGQQLLALAPMPEWLRTIIYVFGVILLVIIAVVCVAALLQAVGVPVRFPTFLR